MYPAISFSIDGAQLMSPFKQIGLLRMHFKVGRGHLENLNFTLFVTVANIDLMERHILFGTAPLLSEECPGFGTSTDLQILFIQIRIA